MSSTLSPDSFYLPFVDLVRKSVQCATLDQEVQKLLDGAAADEVHAKIPRPLRAKDGIFFSGHALAQEAADFAQDLVKKGSKIFDPACGAGDLLISVAKLLPLQADLQKTLEDWGGKLGGTDLHQTFVDATKWRLVLLAKNRHGIFDALEEFSIKDFFKNIRQLDYLKDPTVSNGYDCILVNPPFGHRQAEGDCTWSTGRTQLAAIFMEKVFLHRLDGQVVVAILPDVLRGGTRYERWRQMVIDRASIVKTKIYGRFEKRTDVDVFISRYDFSSEVSTINLIDQSSNISSGRKTVGDVFLIKVGSVVPHRHTGRNGAWKPYLCVSNARINHEILVKKNRRYDGSCVTTPFVAIRRTSNPSDKQRIICTIVIGPELVAVENHLMVASPKNRNIEDCRKLVEFLGSQQATDHINNQLRCRHLTVGALKSIPLDNWES